MSTSTSPTIPNAKPNRSNPPFLSEEWFKDFLTPKMIMDMKFCMAGFTVMVLIIFHYAWIMKRLIINPYLQMQYIAIYFIIFGANVFLQIYILLYVLYPRIYEEETENGRTDMRKKEE